MSNRVRVSYSALPSFISSDNWQKVRAALVSQLPLRNIHWKSASRPSIRTIQELDLTLVPFESSRDEHTSQIPVTMLEKPFLNIYIVTCEEFDLETYRNTVKKQIKDWHNIATSRKNQEWLILHITRPDSRAPTGIFQLKGSVLDKIRTDFNVDKRDRCVQLAWTSGHENPAAWADLLNKIKDGILSAFDAAVVQREEEVKRSEGQKQMPGWNFCTFFILKESLSFSFEGVNLFDEALAQYDELELSFYQVLKEKNLSWFGALISPGPEDDSLPLLSVTKKSYRDLILANTISVFDLRIYLLARQCAILSKMGRIHEVGKKSSAFLSSFGMRLRESNIKIPEYFVESWIYSSALSVVEQSDAWAKDYTMEGPTLTTYNAGKGELFELARNQLDIIGIRAAHLPSTIPFSIAFPRSPVKTEHSTWKITKNELLSSLEDREVFYSLYIRITNKAIDMYAKGSRRKFALKMHGSLAALDVHRNRLESALTTYSSLPAHYAPHMWASLESFMLSKALDTHFESKKPKDKEWIHILLSYLKTYVETHGAHLLIHEEDKVEYITLLVKSLRTAAGELADDLSHSDHPAVTITVANQTKVAGTEDGCFLDVVLHNRLPCCLPADVICVNLTGREGERFRFETTLEILAPGTTCLTVFCPTSSVGTYLLDSTELRISRLTFQWTHQKVTHPGKLRTAKERVTLVRMPRDLRALDVRLQQPNSIELGTPPTLLLIIASGRNDLSKVKVKLSAPSGVIIQCERATMTSNNATLFEPASGSITISGIAQDQYVSMSIPHSDASAFQAMKVSIDVEYTTTSQPSVVRTVHLTRVIVTSLPVAVNVEDFFRGERLFSKFTISTTSHQHVRILSARLDGPKEALDGVKIVACLPGKRGVVTVTPAQPADFLFYLDSAFGPVREPLSLVVKYRMLREEVEDVVIRCVDSSLADEPTLLVHRHAVTDQLVEALEVDASWVDGYAITGELDVPIVYKEEGDAGAALLQVKKALLMNRHVYPPVGEWREITIPVDVPYMNIIAAAKISIAAKSDQEGPRHQPLYAGQPISALLSIQTSFHWGPSANDKERTYMMRFDIEEVVRDWLVSGRKRGDFVASDGGTYTVPVTLIALHHGELALPKILVTALPLSGEVTMGSMALPSTETCQKNGAQRVLVLPRGGRSTYVLGMGPE